MQPQNGIIGSNAVDLPVAQPDQQVLDEEKKIAKYSKSAEFQRLADYMRGRIEFYQRCLPNGVEIENLPPEDQQKMWGPANTVIREFNAVIKFYEETAAVVEANESK